MAAIIAYCRVSTDKQGRSGLGLEAQQAAIDDYARSTGVTIAATYVEVESGADDDRAELDKALAHAKRIKATLVVAKLDRLSRKASFLLHLQSSPVRIVIATMPNIDKLSFGVLAIFAEAERDMISARTKSALAAAKARGVKLGCPDATRTAAIAREAKSDKARQRAENLLPIVRDIQTRGGVTSLRGIATVLEARGIKTPKGGSRWFPAQVQRLIELGA